MANSNVLSRRYATKEMNYIFSEEGKILAERELWIAVMKAQKELGMYIPAEDIEKFERAKHDINLQRITEIEKVRKHDVKARIEAFVEAASGAGEFIHLGMTSRDLTDNVEQMQNLQAAGFVFNKYVSVLRHFLDKASAYSHIVLTARTHHQAAQPTLLGRRMAMWAEELLFHVTDLESFIEKYPLRGIKGPVGTQSDMNTLLKDADKVDRLEGMVAEHLGFSAVLHAPGQVYFRSLDYALLSRLAGLSAAVESFAKTMRLMAGYELVTEGFKEGQVGSSAMPHKMNTPHSERICGLSESLKAFVDGASRISGDQWEEGDVSCSVPRRIFLENAFYASDGICETTLNVLNGMGEYPVLISREVDRYLPFMASTELLSMAVGRGVGREQAHTAIKKQMIAGALAMRQGGAFQMAPALAQDELFSKAGITESEIREVLDNQQHFIGNAYSQILKVVSQATAYTGRFPSAAAYEPKPIL